MLSDRCPVLSVLSCPVCDLGVLWPNSWTDQDETWHAGRHRPWPHCVRWRPSSKGAQPPPNFRPISVVAKWGEAQHPSPSKKFSPCLLWPNGWMDQDGIWHGSRPQPRRLFVRWRSKPPPEEGGRAYFCCGQTAGCIKVPLGMEVVIRPGDFLLDGDPA